MLVLSRHIGEVVVIGTGVNTIRVQVVDIRGDKIRLGFDAPKHIEIHREEVHRAIKRGQKQKQGT